MNNLLDRIQLPQDLKKLSFKQLEALCAEIRHMLIHTVSHTGGHLSSNLGVVELTVALHKIFDAPQDQIVWDVGHQSYTHKILTGRKEKMHTLRQKNGLSGFPKPSESPYDAFVAGHSSTSISVAAGLARAKAIKGEPGYAIAVIGILIVAMLFRDKGTSENTGVIDESKRVQLVENPNFIYAFIPVFPVLILFLGNTIIPSIKMGVAQTMLVGTILCLLVTRTNPQEFSKQFFSGMGKGYGEILGIIIAAGVFAAGLTATGLVQSFVDLLKESNDIARWGGSFGPWCLGVITGSGDASTFAFNEAVTPHAQHFGMEVPNLGALAFLAGVLGRTASPISGAMVVVSGIAMVNPLEVSKRTFVPSLIALIALALTIV